MTGGPQPCSTAVTDAPDNDAYTADQIASAYNFSSLYGAGDEGAGITVALFELEPNLTSDIAAYQTCYGTSATVNYIKEDGGAGTGAGEGEAALDIEDIIGLAPKATIDVYQAPNSDTGLIDNYTAIVDEDTAQVVSTSWGECESRGRLADHRPRRRRSSSRRRPRASRSSRRPATTARRTARPIRARRRRPGAASPT